MTEESNVIEKVIVVASRTKDSLLGSSNDCVQSNWLSFLSSLKVSKHKKQSMSKSEFPTEKLGQF